MPLVAAEFPTESRSLATQIVDLVRGGSPSRIASQALLSSLQEVLRLAIVQVLRDPLAATQLGNAVLAAQAFQNDPDLLLGRRVLARRPSDVLNNLLSCFLRCPGLLSHLRSVNVTMSQKLSLIQSARSVQ